ncbi:MAG: hypothetical protein H6923_01210 [Alphaproteobacteria bacterium]|nr:hypothetical protein [Alphaproteobacteria bacterium]
MQRSYTPSPRRRNDRARLIDQVDRRELFERYVGYAIVGDDWRPAIRAERDRFPLVPLTQAETDWLQAQGIDPSIQNELLLKRARCRFWAGPTGLREFDFDPEGTWSVVGMIFEPSDWTQTHGFDEPCELVAFDQTRFGVYLGARVLIRDPLPERGAVTLFRHPLDFLASQEPGALIVDPLALVEAEAQGWRFDKGASAA